MKKFLTVFSVLVALVVVFSSCSKNDDPQPPKVKFELVKVDPASGTKGITRLHKFTLTFSKEVMLDQAALAKCFSYESQVKPTGFSWVISGSGKTVTIQFTSTGYIKGQEFFISITGLKSADGETLLIDPLHYFMVN